jgi:hypothetical protein
MDDPYPDTYLFPRISGVMVSIIAFGIVLYSTEVFSGKYILENGGKRRWWV